MQDSPTRPTAVKYGLILGGALIAYSLLLYTLGQSHNQALGYVTYAIILGVIILAFRKYKELNEGFMSFKQGLGIGMLISLVGGVISSIYSYIFVSFIDTNFIDETLAKAREELEKNPQMTEEMIDQAMDMTANFTSPAMLFLFGILGILFFGLILSLITSAIMKKDRPVSDVV